MLQQAAMTTLSELFHRLCAKTLLLLAFLIIHLIILIRKLIKSDTCPITTPQYLQLIEEKNPTICYTNRLRLKAEQGECTICLTELEEGEKVRSLKCRHTFHKDCVDKWLQRYWATCPLCRNRVLPHDVVSKYREGACDVSDDRLTALLSTLRAVYRYV